MVRRNGIVVRLRPRSGITFLMHFSSDECVKYGDFDDAGQSYDSWLVCDTLFLVCFGQCESLKAMCLCLIIVFVCLFTNLFVCFLGLCLAPVVGHCIVCM